jgi:hypothetical protein
VIDVQSLTVESEDATLRVDLRYVVKATGTVRDDVITGGTA